MNNSRVYFPILLVAILLSLWINGCVDLPTDLKAPQWDVDLNVPLVNRSYTLNDIIKKQKYISIQGTSSTESIYVLQSDTYLQNVNITNSTKVNSEMNSLGNIVPVSNAGSATIYYAIPDGTELESAVFMNGLLSFHVVNSNSEDVNVSVTFPGIIKNGTELIVPMTVPAYQQDSVQISLAGYTYSLPANQSTQNRSSVQMIISATSLSLPVLSVVTIDFYSSNFYLSSAKGYLPSKSLGSNSQTFQLNLGNVSDYSNKASLKYGSIDLYATYYHSLPNPFVMQAKNLNIIGTREDGSQIALHNDSTGSSYFNFNIENGFKHLNYTEANSNINDFISFLPDKILLNAEYIMNPDNISGAITNQDSLIVSAVISTKSVLSLQKTLMTDTTSTNISDQDGLKIKDAKSAYINVNVENGIPLDSWLTVSFVDGQYNPLFSDSVSFAAAAINSSGEVTSTVTTNNLIQLDSTQTAKLARARYAISSVYVQTNGASNSSAPYVAIRPDDLIKINVYGGVKYHVNTDDLK
jgi:hypothetical protein